LGEEAIHPKGGNVAQFGGSPIAVNIPFLLGEDRA